MFSRRRNTVADYIESSDFRRARGQGRRSTTDVDERVLDLRRTMRDPVAVVSAIIAVVEIIQIRRTAVDGKESRGSAAPAGVRRRRVRGVTAGAGTMPAEKVLGPGISGGCGAIEGGAQTENFIDLVFYRGEQEAGVHIGQ